MLGRVRPASSSLESLELERVEPCKITKHHSLSIYEATLVKLREGAQRKLSSVEEQEMKIDTDLDSAGNQLCGEVMMIDTHLSPCTVLSGPSESKEQRNKPVTVVSMFDRYDALPKYDTWSGGVEKLYFADKIRNMWRGGREDGPLVGHERAWLRCMEENYPTLQRSWSGRPIFLDHMTKFIIKLFFHGLKQRSWRSNIRSVG